jgi:hypothetical protein
MGQRGNTTRWAIQNLAAALAARGLSLLPSLIRLFALIISVAIVSNLWSGLLSSSELNSSARSWSANHLHIANECARRALEVSLRAQSLNNLDRARLLDILLWSGDIVSSSRNYKPSHTTVGIKARHERPHLPLEWLDNALPN